MDCNWCAVCSKHFHSDHQASLYCSEKCRKADALACCAFHDCDHPDGSAHHDHLTFCHHHRPAIRIPSLPLVNYSSNPFAEQQPQRQGHEDEWAQFLHQQYNATQGQVAGMLQSHHRHSYHHHPEPRSFLVPDRRPSISNRQQSASLEQQQQHKPGYHSRHQRNPTIITKHLHYETDRLSFSLDSLSLSTHNERIPATTSCDMDHCGQPCVSRKNKVLPPPTLSPILPPKISNPASLSPTGATFTPQLSPLSGYSDDENQDGSLSHAWPSMDKFFFPDHCCRTSACRPSTQPGTTARSNNNKKGNGNNKISRNKKSFVSELPPPPASTSASRDSDGCIALSASIWGAGWRQVEPLPESFVKMAQKSNLLWDGCEREHYHHKRRTRQTKTHGHHNNASNASSSSWATVCTSRLPRSLQFID
ncbi:hypothetical protein EDD21DRAFT_371135 [Dissophora ornata]|nr:hypothetical protein EDD21DRAFT_371135 [Dissophora ornata]